MQTIKIPHLDNFHAVGPKYVCDPDCLSYFYELFVSKLSRSYKVSLIKKFVYCSIFSEIMVTITTRLNFIRRQASNIMLLM